MARGKEEIKTDRGKVHFRILEFDLEGGNATLQESLRTIAAAINRASANGTTKVIVTKTEATPALGGDVAAEEPVTDHVEEIQDEDAGVSDDGSGQKRKRSYPTPVVIDPLDMKTKAPSFQEFVEKHECDTQNGKYLVALAYLKAHTNYTEANQDHVYTLFKLMKWAYGKDFSQPLRNLKRAGYAKSSARGAFVLNHVGENEVQKLEKVSA